jgi:flagellar protein FlaG
MNTATTSTLPVSTVVSQAAAQQTSVLTNAVGQIPRSDRAQTLRPVESPERAGKKGQQEDRLNAKATKELVEELNDYMDDLKTSLGFSIREELNHQVVVEIKNRQTDELIKQIPSEELLKIRERMAELTGFLFDQSV